MELVLRLVLLTLAVGLAVQTARPHLRYGEWLDASSILDVAGQPVPFGMGAIIVLLHIGKVSMPAVAAMYWRRSQYVCAALALLLFPVLVAVSITGTIGFLDVQRSERVVGETTRLKREADLRAELAAIEARLQKIGWWRPAAVVESEIAAERHDPLWAGSDSCNNATTRVQLRYCKGRDRLTGELAAAREAEDDRRREKEIRAELLGMKATNSSPQPDLDFLSRALEVSLERAGFWRTILFAAAVEAAEALFLLFGSMPAPRGAQRAPRSPLLDRFRSPAVFARVRETLIGFYGLIGTPPTSSRVVASPTNLVASSKTRGVLAQAPKCRRRHAQTRQADFVASPPPPEAEFALAPLEAVAAFVAQLPKEPGARATGSVLLAEYKARRLVHGWPDISSGPFGRHLKTAVEAVGGQKVKANAQYYVGVAVPLGER